MKQENIEGIQLQKIYKKNYLKLLLSHELQRYEFHSFNNSHRLNYHQMIQWQKRCILDTLKKPFSFYRKACVQYLVEQWIKNTSQHKWSIVFHDYIRNLIQNEREIIQDLCITLAEDRIDSLFINTVAPIKRLTIRLDRITPDIITNTEMFLKSLMSHDKNFCNPLEINFDINCNIKRITSENSKIREINYNDNNDEEDEKREEQIEEIIHLINKYFNSRYVDYSPPNYYNNTGKHII